MARGFLVLLLLVSICEASSVFQPISDSHRSAALELFAPVDGSFGSLEKTYEALRSFEVLGVDKKPGVSSASCASVSNTLDSSSSTPKDLFFALKVNGILKCNTNNKALEDIISRLKTAVNDASSLIDFYHAVGSLVLIKEQSSKADPYLADAEGVFRSIKALSQSDGRWRFSSSNTESSAFAAGIALQTLAGVVSLASSEIDQSMIGTLKNDILKLFDGIEKYDNGAFYFDEKLTDAHEHQGPLSTTSAVVRGVTSFAAVTDGSLNIPGDKILGLAKFFLGIGVPGDAKDFFNQINSLACLENNRVSIPLILSLPSTVLSLTKKDSLKVRVNTALGSSAPPSTVKLVGAFSSNSKDASVIDSQELKFDPETGVFYLNDLPKSIDVGSYVFAFEALLKLKHESKVEHIFVLGSSKKQFELRLDFLGLVEKFYYLSGRYDIELTLGDAVMENSLLCALGHIELDLPEKASRRPPLQAAVDPYSTRYGPPKAEIAHIFRAPEKRPPRELSLAFLGLVTLPFFGFLIGLWVLGVNLNNFPTKTVPATFAVLFHVGIGAVLLLYALFWLKLDLFTTLKALGFLGVFILFVGHRILSYLASSTSSKLKTT